MDSLIKTLPALLNASGAPEEVAEAACVAMWRHAVGDGLSSHAVPIHLRDQKLTLAVEDELWKKQLEQMRGQLLSRLNYVFGQALVSSIELKVDPRTLAASRGPAPKSGDAEIDRSVPIELVSVAAGIEDANLRRAFLRAATSCINRVEKQQT